MLTLRRLLIVRLAVALALCAQVAGPALAAFSGSGRLDPYSIICAPAGAVSPELIASVERLLLAFDIPHDHQARAHCDLCLTAGAAALVSAPEASTVPFRLSAGSRRSPPKAIHVRFRTRGPPLGLRAPPLSI